MTKLGELHVEYDVHDEQQEENDYDHYGSHQANGNGRYCKRTNKQVQLDHEWDGIALTCNRRYHRPPLQRKEEF